MKKTKEDDLRKEERDRRNEHHELRKEKKWKIERVNGKRGKN